MDWSKEIVCDKELEAEKRIRTSDYYFRNEAEEASARFLDDGWAMDRKLANHRVKMKKRKPESEVFENRVWMMLYKMGFPMLNRGRKFTIDYSVNGGRSSQQIDVLAIDDEIVLVVECKCAQAPGTSKSFKSVIEKIDSVRKGVFGELKKNYPGHKMVYGFATCNYIVGSADQELMGQLHIPYFNEKSIEYYESLGKTLGRASRYQLLGNLFAGKEIKGMDTSVAAIRGKMGGLEYYSFVIEPAKLLKLAYVLHRNSAQPDELLPTYQRVIKRPRLKEVTKFVNEGGYFPNSIIVNVSEGNPRFELAPTSVQPKDRSARIGLLTLPKMYRSIYIIDGQHRLYGYADSDYADRDVVPVVAFYDMDKKAQIKMFMDINEKQKAVPQSLRTTLNSDLLWDSSDMSERQKALRSILAQNLGEMKNSPLYDRVIVGENGKTKTRTITLPFVDSAIAQAGYLGKYRDGVMESDGLFEYGDVDESLKKLRSFLFGCFAFIRDTSPKEWQKTSEEGAIFTVNVGFAAVVRLCADILTMLRARDGLDVRNEDVQNLVDDVSYYLLSLVTHIENLDMDGRKEFTKKYGGNAVNECLWRFRRIVHNSYSYFCPDGLLEWMRDHSMQYNEDAKRMLRYIEESVTKDFESILERSCGSGWLLNNVDRSVYNSLAQRAATYKYNNGVVGDVDLWTQATLEECRKIAVWSRNWTEVFKGYFEKLYGDDEARTKADSTAWLSDFAKIIKQLDSVKGYSISLDEFNRIKYYFELLGRMHKEQ